MLYYHHHEDFFLHISNQNFLCSNLCLSVVSVFHWAYLGTIWLSSLQSAWALCCLTFNLQLIGTPSLHSRFLVSPVAWVDSIPGAGLYIWFYWISLGFSSLTKWHSYPAVYLPLLLGSCREWIWWGWSPPHHLCCASALVPTSAECHWYLNTNGTLKWCLLVLFGSLAILPDFYSPHSLPIYNSPI